MKNKTPVGIMLVGSFYIFGAIVILIALVLGTNQDTPMNVRFGIPFISDTVVTIFIAVVSVLIAYGYIKTLKWGYWSMIVYSVDLIIISFILALSNTNQLFIGNAIFSSIVLIYTYLKRDIFLSKP